MSSRVGVLVRVSAMGLVVCGVGMWVSGWVRHALGMLRCIMEGSVLAGRVRKGRLRQGLWHSKY